MAQSSTREELFEFEPTTKYKLIYIFAIGDEAHSGCLKIGDATLMSSKPYRQILDNCKELNDAAWVRIRQYTNTAGITASIRLLHTELAVRERVNGRGANATIYLESFKDTDVHRVLENSGIQKKVFPRTTCRDWYIVDLPTAIEAITAYKNLQPVLASHQITHEDPPIVLREEQNDAVERTLARFKKKNDMLWDAKMRFGKTLTALEVVRRSHDRNIYPKPFRRVLIATHRPVVSSGWQEDFRKTFRSTDAHYEFIDKSTLGGNSYNMREQDENDRILRLYDSQGRNFIYFASVQDLRGSKLVGGDFPKNVAVFVMDWDLIIIDEAHEGLQTELGDRVTKKLIKAKTKVLSLSGTPFNILGQFEEDAVYVWDYVMEQRRKETWDEDHPGEPNPYADMPKMHILTYDIGAAMSEFAEEDLEGKAFNFREFFRTWTGDEEIDHRKMPRGVEVGDFIHAEDVRSFLDLITRFDPNSRYPFASSETRALFKHTLWMIPGVKEAAALSKMLRDHPVFGNFGIANVAGQGDDYEDAHREEALQLVRETIAKNEYSITLSCGKLTTGVTVKEWTAAMMLSGSSTTSAAGYMQTIFRVQSAGSIDGKQKTDCFVFDFAPDRALKVLAETAQISRKVSKNDATEEHGRRILGEFLNYCPVIALNGSKMEKYDVKTMMASIKHIFVMKAIRNGFDDDSIYSDKLLNLGKLDLKQFEELRKIVGTTKQTEAADTVIVDMQGFDDEEREAGKKKPTRELTPEEKAERAERKKKREEKKRAISILRAISIRMPLLIYGADVPVDKIIKIADFVRLVDQESWDEFMPTGVTKELFGKFMEYYDPDVFEAAGLEIRKLAKSADKLPPTQRVMQIARIFGYFKNPDKETVLTPWRVVNMHMSDTLGGWCFWDKEFEKPLEDGPRFVSQGEATRHVFGNDASKVLEINSKSGLYPLYVAYSLYRRNLGAVPEEDIAQKARLKIWNDVIRNSLYVVCKTPMAESITRRTLAGYTSAAVNALYFSELNQTLKEKPQKFVRKVLDGKIWKKENMTMKFDAAVGNPPYQMMDMGNKNSASPVYQFFFQSAKDINADYISMIMPSRWFSGGKGLDAFRDSMLNDKRIAKLVDFPNAKDCFPSTSIGGGVCYVLRGMKETELCEVTNIVGGSRNTMKRRLDQFNVFIRYNESISILDRIVEKREASLAEVISARNPFGIPTNFKGKSRGADGDYAIYSSGENVSYVAPRNLPDGADEAKKWKLLISRTSSEHAGEPDRNGQYNVISTMRLLKPGEVCSDTYLIACPSARRSVVENFHGYLKSRFVRFIIMQTLSSINLSRDAYALVPLQDFSEPWDDAKLYRKYGITKEEQKFIESMIKPMA